MGIYTQHQDNAREYREDTERLCRLTRDAERLIMNKKLDEEEARMFFRCLADMRLQLNNLNAVRADASAPDGVEDKMRCELSAMIKAMQADLDLARNRGSAQMSAGMTRGTEKKWSFLDH